VESLPASERPTLAQLANGPGKSDPTRARGRELAEILDWGDGDSNHPDRGRPQAVLLIETLTREQIAKTLLTIEEATFWAMAYQDVADRDKNNVSAGPRSQLMRCIARFLGIDRSAPGTTLPRDCCVEELAYLHPSDVGRQGIRNR
jgi:hypothetical protein